MNAPTHQALAESSLGVALLHIERGEMAEARALLVEAVAGGVSVGANASLYHGAPALEFVLRCGGHRVGVHITDAVDRVVAARLAAARERARTGERPSSAEFDLISGLTGLGALLLGRGPRDPALAEVLSYLIDLAHPIQRGSLQLPGWWSDTNVGTGAAVPGGHANNGMAHGAAGPLALLAMAARRGVRAAGQHAAIDIYAHWLETYGRFYWITLGQVPNPGTPPRLRPSWCYGVLGIARALQHAGIALNDPERKAAAEEAALNALTDPVVRELTCDASLCHGWAGLLTVIRAIAGDSPDPSRFHDLVTELRERTEASLGTLTKPGFLEGRAGALLALSSTDSGWTRALLID
ncbi:lanthionine synthetase C family protein [Actinospica robiniae]|uniref:lanthionine synthetase C family protein n=1 Tax=Actinospica robiniae TaxID=304901 RepID=UPI000413BB38|nr:lanthionine synthetase C family protein [Actinospica robiniae]